MKLGMQVASALATYIVLDGDPAPPPSKAQSPQFSAHICSGQMPMSLAMEVGLRPSDIVLDADPAPAPPKRGQSPQFSAHVYCGQTAGWIKMALGMEVGLGPGDVVLDGDAVLP